MRRVSGEIDGRSSVCAEQRQMCNEEGELSKSLLMRSYSLPYMHAVIRACYRVAERLESRWDSRPRELPMTCHMLVTVRIPTGRHNLRTVLLSSFAVFWYRSAAYAIDKFLTVSNMALRALE